MPERAPVPVTGMSADIVLAFARVLYVNGQATEQTMDAIGRLGRTLGLRARLMLRWGEVQLQDKDTKATSVIVAADPVGVDMDRVASTMRAIEDIEAGRLAPGTALNAIEAISRAPPTPTWLFTLAAAAGAMALAVIFGVEHVSATALIFVSAAIGAVLRRGWRD